jgi:hypothetical protein
VSRSRTNVIRSLDQIPRFESEEDEDRFWSTHRFSRELLEQGSSPPKRVSDILATLRAARASDRSAGGSPSPGGGSGSNRTVSPDEFPAPVKDL